MSDIDIIVFGDSITYGLSDNELGGWVNRLKTALENKKDNHKYYVFNLGIPGQTTNDILYRFDSECKARFNGDDETLIIFAIGIKDSQIIDENNRVNIEKFKSNILDLIFQSKKYSNKIYFIGLTKVDESKKKGYLNDEIIKFDHELENICLFNQVEYIKMYDLLTFDELADGLHPNSNAHKKMSDRVIENLAEIGC